MYGLEFRIQDCLGFPFMGRNHLLGTFANLIITSAHTCEVISFFNQFIPNDNLYLTEYVFNWEYNGVF